MIEEAEVLIIGGGVMGAAAAWALARSKPRGRVVLFEQYEFGHTRGSSHGGSRIIRYTHSNVDEAALMPEIFGLWREIARESGTSLLSICGGLFIGDAESDPFLSASITALSDLNLPFELLDGAGLARRYPQFRLHGNEVALLQPDSGVVAASTAVAALLRIAQTHGIELRDGCAVLSIEPSGEGMLVHYADGADVRRLRAAKVIVCAGPWAPDFLSALLPQWPPLPLQVTFQQVAYFRVEDASRWRPAACPIFIYTAEPHLYGFPIFEQQGRIKVARELFDSTVDPREERVVRADLAADLAHAARSRLSGIESEPLAVTPCLYTETPNRDFIVDRHPDWPNLIFAAGFSGRGFKFAPGVGTLLAELATGEGLPADSRYWLPRWSLDRFRRPATGVLPGAELFSRPVRPGPSSSS